MMGVTPELVELSDEVLHFTMPHCPLCIEGTSKELCEALMAHDAKMTGTLLGQEVNMEIPKSVAVGDKECEVIFTSK